MAIDPRRLRPSVLTRMLNSTPLGEVINERQLHRHRSRAGYRIGDDRHIDLYRYTAWLALQRREPKREAGPADYEAMKEAARARNARLSAIGRDIGSIPPVADPERKERAASDFRFFCEAYFPEAFCLPWSPDHLKVEFETNERLLADYPEAHQMLSEHLTAEYRVRTEARGRGGQPLARLPRRLRRGRVDPRGRVARHRRGHAGPQNPSQALRNPERQAVMGAPSDNGKPTSKRGPPCPDV